MAARSAIVRAYPHLSSLLGRRAHIHIPQIPRIVPSAPVFAPQSSRFFSSNNVGDGSKETAAPDTESKDQETTPEPEKAEEAVMSKEEQLEAQVKELKDQLLRSLAEQDNTRRIAANDIEAARQFAIKSFAKSLLDVSDNLSRALEAVPEDVLADREKNPVLGSLYEGIQLTERGLDKAFEMNGLVKFGEIGDKFDPNQHEALLQYRDPSKDSGVIGQVMKKGFLLNKRVLRPAEVGVIKN